VMGLALLWGIYTFVSRLFQAEEPASAGA
jgi:hypothetical protein